MSNVYLLIRHMSYLKAFPVVTGDIGLFQNPGKEFFSYNANVRVRNSKGNVTLQHDLVFSAHERTPKSGGFQIAYKVATANWSKGRH